MDHLCDCGQLCCSAARYITSKKCYIVCYPPDYTRLQQLLHMCIKKCFRHLYGKHLVQKAVCLMDLGKDITLKIIVCKQYTHNIGLVTSHTVDSCELLLSVYQWKWTSHRTDFDSTTSVRTGYIAELCWHICCLQNYCYSCMPHCLAPQILWTCFFSWNVWFQINSCQKLLWKQVVCTGVNVTFHLFLIL